VERRKNVTGLCEVAEEDERANCDNSLLVHDLEPMGNGNCKEPKSRAYFVMRFGEEGSLSMSSVAQSAGGG
jgi:hypothetical protein